MSSNENHQDFLHRRPVTASSSAGHLGAIALSLLELRNARPPAITGHCWTHPWKTRLVEGGFPDRSFDIEFWPEQGDEAIFEAAWELVEPGGEVRNGRKPTLQRTARSLKRI